MIRKIVYTVLLAALSLIAQAQKPTQTLGTASNRVLVKGQFKVDSLSFIGKYSGFPTLDIYSDSIGVYFLNTADRIIYVRDTVVGGGHQWRPWTYAGGLNRDIQYNYFGQVAGTSGHATWDSATEVLYADSMNNHMMVQTVDTNRGILQVYPVTQGPGFYMSLDQTFTNPDGGKDNVYGYGLFNMIGDASRVNLNYPAFGVFTETHFQAGGSKQMEHHWVAGDSLGRFRRIQSTLINELTANAYQYWTLRHVDWFPGTTLFNRPYFSIDENGSFGGMGNLPVMQLTDTVPTHGQFEIITNNDGSAIMSNGTTGTNAVIGIGNETVFLPTASGQNIDIDISSTVGNPGGIFLSGHTTTLAFPWDYVGSADQGVILQTVNQSTNPGAFAVDILSSQGAGNGAPIYILRIPTHDTSDWNLGFNPINFHFQIGYSNSGLLTSGILLELAGDGTEILSTYGLGNHTGTAAFGAAFDGSGKLIEVPSTGVIASGYFIGQTAAKTLATSTVGASDGSFRVGGNVTITAVSVDVLNLQVNWTDETGTARTQLLFPAGSTSGSLGATGAFTFSPLDIRAQAASTITVSVTLLIGTGSVTYNAGGNIGKLY